MCVCVCVCVCARTRAHVPQWITDVCREASQLNVIQTTQITQNFCVLHIQSNTTIFHPVVQWVYNYMFQPYMLAIFRLWFNLQSSYTRCVGCSFRVLGVGWGERDLVSIVGIMTTWRWPTYRAKTCSCIPTALLGEIQLCSTVCAIHNNSLLLNQHNGDDAPQN